MANQLDQQLLNIFSQKSSFIDSMGHNIFSLNKLHFIEPYANLEYCMLKKSFLWFNHYEKLLIKCLWNSISHGIV